MAENKDYYQILGIDRNASQDDIKKAYKKMCLKWHPDRWASATEKEKKEAEEHFKDVNEANSILSDENKRQHYDMFGTTDNVGGFNPFDGFADMGGFNPFNPFSGFGFGSGQPHVSKGQDIKIKVKISFEESFNGCKKTVKYRQNNVCPDCHGTGAEGNALETCPHCHGTGRIRNVSRYGNIQSISETGCPYCHGEGKIIKNKCHKCNGTGFISTDTEIEVDIPKGVISGYAIILRNQGHASKNGGPNGSLIVVIEADEKCGQFKRSGDDLILELLVDLSEAWIGCKKQAVSLDGKEYIIDINPLTASGTEYRFKGKGFSWNESIYSGTHDFIVRLVYQVPKNLTEEQKELLKKFYDLEKSK